MLSKFFRSRTTSNMGMEIDATRRVLYILVERDTKLVGNYLANIGINIKNIYNDIEEVKIAMLVEQRPAKLVIIESGEGKFTYAAAKEEIYDLLGICDTGDRVITIYHVRPTLKTEFRAGRTTGSKIKWYKYKGMASALSDISKGVIGITEDGDRKIGDSFEDIRSKLEFTGEEVQSDSEID